MKDFKLVDGHINLEGEIIGKQTKMLNENMQPCHSTVLCLPVSRII